MIPSVLQCFIRTNLINFCVSVKLVNRFALKERKTSARLHYVKMRLWKDYREACSLLPTINHSIFHLIFATFLCICSTQVLWLSDPFLSFLHMLNYLRLNYCSINDTDTFLNISFQLVWIWKCIQMFSDLLDLQRRQCMHNTKVYFFFVNIV